MSEKTIRLGVLLEEEEKLILEFEEDIVVASLIAKNTRFKLNHINGVKSTDKQVLEVIYENFAKEISGPLEKISKGLLDYTVEAKRLVQSSDEIKEVKDEMTVQIKKAKKLLGDVHRIEKSAHIYSSQFKLINGVMNGQLQSEITSLERILQVLDEIYGKLENSVSQVSQELKS